MIHVCHLFISPGHNYRGHHGREPGTHPVVELHQIECVAGRGLRGDRYFEQKPDSKGQITFFAWEVFEQFRDELRLGMANPSGFRRNVLTAGIDLNTLIGQTFEIQGVGFLGTEECRPCYWMNEAFQDPRAEEWLRGKGGLRAKILTNGILKRDA